MTQRRAFLQSAAAGALFGGAAIGQALAQSGLPIDQVKVLYGFPPGSAGDICARRVAERFAGTSYSRNQGVIDSRPGAGGQIALNVLKNSPADGSVLAMTPFSAISLYPHIFRNLQYKPFEDFTPIGTSYDDSPQNANGSCSTGVTTNALAQADLAVQVIGTNGTTVLAPVRAGYIAIRRDCSGGAEE